MFVDVILPLPLKNSFTYSVPAELAGQVDVGYRVVVSFGKKKFYTAIVYRKHTEKPSYEVKDITTVLDREPIVLPVQLKLWEWMAEYYLCTLGDIYTAALPSGLKLESETVVELNPEYEAAERLSGKEQKVLDVLSTDGIYTLTKLIRACEIPNIVPVVKSLLDKEAVFVKEEMKRTYKPKTELYVELAPDYRGEEALRTLLDGFTRAPKQLAVLMKYMELAMRAGKDLSQSVSRRELLEKSHSSPAVLQELVKKGILEMHRKEIGRLGSGYTDIAPLNPLNESQQEAFKSIQNQFEDKNVVLLHGVTSSGKTEIYIHLIREMLAQGKQVLYLLPEIALTTQITTRLFRVFGNRLGVYHSKYSDAERVEIWKKQLGEEPYDIILGARSSVLLPFKNPGLIIVDEEHENSYKQYDPAPRYHARSVAIVLASLYHAKTLLGTATPSLESYYNASTDKYGLTELNERYQHIQLPEIIQVDIKELTRKKRMIGRFSPLLVEKMKQALDHKEQVILFQNRRGFAPMVECNVCGWVPKCKNCDVSLTYHKGINHLTCHYCGYTYPYPNRCPACESTDVGERGFGTEKVEDEIQLVFPEARVARMDLDTARSRSAYERIISDYQEGRIDILVGTQMVSKGLDFDRVSVVGILNADTLLNYPDFRAYERAFQLMAQVSGRSGRKGKQGTVVLQTRSADHPIIRQVIENNFLQMYRDQMGERQLFRYPPYYRFIYVYIKHKDAVKVNLMAQDMATRLRDSFGDRVLGPDNPPVGRIQNLYIKKIIIKIENNASVNRAK
ncbi:MAG: primosomal protein N', partial [Bacteroides sp.]|nr:primosomal protein N' [Bacteroides sp.]